MSHFKSKTKMGSLEEKKKGPEIFSQCKTDNQLKRHAKASPSTQRRRLLQPALIPPALVGWDITNFWYSK